jgi:hypothetical protein
MTGKRLVCLFVFGAILLCGGQALAADCDSCVECAADPSFTQRDARNPATLQLLRNFAPAEIQEQGVTAVVIFSDGKVSSDAEVSAEAEGPKRTVVLVGREGGRSSFEVTGALPAEVKAVVRVK